ncbi:MAG: regulatory proteins IclR, partial [Xanthobacteraceae bacterium]
MQDISAKMVERIAAILRVLAAGDDRGASLQAIAETLDLKKPTAHRILSALTDNGLVFQDMATRNYRLGHAAAVLGRTAFEQDIAGAARASLVRLAALSGDTAFASAIEGPAA